MDNGGYLMEQKLMERKSGRVYTIDVLRTIGLLCVILAHVFPPYHLRVIRSFDVPLMVFVMCWSFLLSNKNEAYHCYVIKRFKRLVVSCWIFLIIYYSAFALFSVVFGTQFHYTLKDIMITALTFEKFGGTWVIRVYFIIALVLPLAKYLSFSIKNKYRELIFWIFLGIVYMIYYFVFALLNKSDSNVFRFITITLGIESVGWIICTFAFSRIICNKKKTVHYFLITLLIFFICGVHYKWSNIDMYKYPPRLYYISYGLVISLLLVLFFNVNIKEITISEIICQKFKCIQWLSKNSLWIYYWHMLYLSLFKFLLERVSILNKWFILYTIVLMFSIITTMIVNFIKTMLKTRFKFI